MIERGVAHTAKQSRDQDQQELDVALEAVGGLHAAHPEPQVVVRAQEQVPDQDRLDDEEPGEGTSHHREPERLRVGVDLGGEPVAGEGQGQERADRDEVADVAHPVVVGPLLVRRRVQELEGRVGGRHRAAEGDVRDDAVDVDRHPGVVVDGRPGADHGARLGDAGRRRHEGEPRVGDQHDRGADDVQPEPEQQVRDGGELPPAVVVGVQEERLGEEQQHVGRERRREHVHQVVHELRVEQHQHEEQERPEGRGERERHGQELGELVRQLVVALVPVQPADELDDQGEQRHRQHEGGEQQVQLRQHPDGDAAADHRKAPIGLLDVGLLAVGLRLGRRLVLERLRARRELGLVGALGCPVLGAEHEAHEPRRGGERDRHHHERDDRDPGVQPARHFAVPCAWRCCSISRTCAMIAQRSAGGTCQR